VTLVEFLHPLRASPQRVLVTAALYYGKHYESVEDMTPSQVKALLVKGGIGRARKMNVTRALNQSIPSAHRLGPRGVWAITGTGEDQVRQLLDMPHEGATPTTDVAALERLAKSVRDDSVQDYIEESIKCLRAGALRASVVFLWSGAIHTIREAVWKGSSNKQIDAALKNHNQRAKFTKKGDFEYINDALLLEATVDLGTFDRSEKKRLVEALDLRNDCGHPVKYRAREKKVSSFIEDVVGIVFT